MPPTPALVPEDAAAYYAGRPGTTIRRWAGEGRIRRYGAKPGPVRYNVLELPKAERDELTGDVINRPPPPPLPHNKPATQAA